MLAPRDTPTRERKLLDGLWRFTLDPDGDGRARNWPGGLPREAREVPVPASYNDIFTDPEVHDHVGEVWYETTVRVPSGWAGQRIVDSILRWDTIPPGYVVETPDGPRQHLLFDFFNYAGLHRTVWLYSTPLSYVADVSVGTGLDGPGARSVTRLTRWTCRT